MKFTGSVKQAAWAQKILAASNLTREQVENLLRWAGPEAAARGVMDAEIVIQNRDGLASYADALGRMYAARAARQH